MCEQFLSTISLQKQRTKQDKTITASTDNSCMNRGDALSNETQTKTGTQQKCKLKHKTKIKIQINFKIITYNKQNKQVTNHKDVKSDPNPETTTKKNKCHGHNRKAHNTAAKTNLSPRTKLKIILANEIQVTI